ncbi:transposase [Caballeronia sp. LP006]|uniref:transposase n=1 Tax=Caballeronia sp. LP006 TaxID=3038552 RepID=UPI00285A6B6A|nr:transposase [Caballeronia sp. LP006]MDR5831505.1 transposase [Caballeronia sp. LP006]
MNGGRNSGQLSSIQTVQATQFFSVEFKRQIVEATLKPGASAALIAREHDINANLLFKWRRHYLSGDFGIPDVALPEATALNWLPVAVAEPSPEVPTCPSSGSASMYEVGFAPVVPDTISHQG